jgi:hypothetical protein
LYDNILRKGLLGSTIFGLPIRVIYGRLQVVNLKLTQTKNITMDSAQKQLIEKLTSSTNILVTVSRNPSVDQLAACIGLTLILNKLDKHATAVFSGEVPSTIEFLKPEGTLEKNTDSLRDFIIALDKSKADKLRYKVEDQLVRIFITPYRTSISEKDLEFSQGDFNVDLVIALGVADQMDLDAAITAHGRILHDATVTSINAASSGALGSINWDEPNASSLCELIGELARLIGKELLDPQIATSLLTGIVAQTGRFSNEKTSPETMTISSELLAAGADQQLVATKLQPPAPKAATPIARVVTTTPIPEPSEELPVPPRASDGTLEIAHDPSEDRKEPPVPPFVPPSEPEDIVPPVPPAPVQVLAQSQPVSAHQESISPSPSLMTEPPLLGGTLTANSQPERFEPSIDPLGLPDQQTGSFTNPTPAAPAWVPPAWASPATDDNPVLISPTIPRPAEPVQTITPTMPAVNEPLPAAFTPLPSTWTSPTVTDNLIVPDAFQLPAVDTAQPTQPLTTPETAAPSVLDNTALKTNTLLNIEEAVHSPHLQTPNVDLARDEVMKALQDSAETPEPIQALNAQPLGGELHHHDQESLITPTAPTQSTPNFAQTLQQAIPSVPPSYAAALLSSQSPAPDSSLPTSTAPLVAPPIIGPVPVAQGASTAPAVPPPIPYRFGNSIDPQS